MSVDRHPETGGGMSPHHRRTVLVTGFEPFGGDATNPSGVVVEAVARRWAGPHHLIAEVLPVEFAAAGLRVRELIASHDPDAVISVGLAGGRTAVSLERVALNLIDSRIPDTAGEQPVDTPSVPGAPAAALASAPVKAWARVMGAAGIPVKLSLSAGTFVCNHVFATAALTAPPATRVGFIHIPWSDEDLHPDVPSLPLATLVRALELACEHVFDDDEHTPAGTIA